jgi:hypothetical protein
MADEAVILDAPVETTTVEADLPALDAETPAVETETPAAEVTEKPAVAAEADAAVTTNAPLKDINAHLQTIKAENPELAKILHSKVSDGLRAQKFLTEVGAKNFAEAKTKLSAGDAEFKSSVAATDALLYEGGESHRELVEGILADLKENSDTPNELLSSLATSLLDKLKEVSPELSVQHERDQFLTASENCGVIESINSLAQMLHSGDTAGAKKLVANMVKFFSGEIEADSKRVRPAAAAVDGKVSPAVEALRTEVNQFVTKTENQILGGFLAEHLRGALKSLTQAQRVDVADSIKRQLRIDLKADTEYVKMMGEKWESMKGAATQKEIMRLYSEKLKGPFGKNLVNKVVRTSHPELYKAAPVAPKAPPSKLESVGGKQVKVYQCTVKPSLVHEDVTIPGHRTFTSSDLELLQISGVGIHKNPKGDYVFVRWNR